MVGYFVIFCWKFTAKSAGERSLKIRQHLAGIEAKI